MSVKRTVLESLTRQRLVDLARAFEADFAPSGMSKGDLIDALARMKRTALEQLLPELSRDELKAACEGLGLDVSGREKQVLIDRLMAADGKGGTGKQGQFSFAGDGSTVEAKDGWKKGNKAVSASSTQGNAGPASPTASGKRLDVNTLESWLWEAACVIRGPVDAPKYKDYILPLIFLKRLSDVFDDEITRLAHDLGDEKTALKIAEQDHKLVRFFLPKKARWAEIAAKTTGVGEYLTDAVRAVARENPKLAGVIDVTDFNATQAGQRMLDDDRLASLIQVLNNPDYRLGLDDVEPDILGRAYEYLLRKFAEGQGQSAGEFYTPREVAVLMARILDPEPGQTVYDPCCGSGGLLIKAHLRLVEKHGEKTNGSRRLPSTVAPLRLFGQETNHSTFAMARMNAFIHDMEAEIALGDTMNRPSFTEGDGSLRQFDLVTANPMWNQKFPASSYENDTYGRFERGIPPSASADWGWIQHMYASLAEGGKMAVVLDTGVASRGSGNEGSNKERDIRMAFVEADLIEAVFLMPENLFYNTTAPAIIMVLNRHKRHKAEILLVNAIKRCIKGRPKNYLGDDHIEDIAGAYSRWCAIDGFSTVITTQEAAKNDYVVSPSRYISRGDEDVVLPLDEAVTLLRVAQSEQAKVYRQLNQMLDGLGCGGAVND